MKLSNAIVAAMETAPRYNYAWLSRDADISRTYLEMILKNNKVPRKPIIERICKELRIDPMNIEEYRYFMAQDVIKDNPELVNDVLELWEARQSSKKKTPSKKSKKTPSLLGRV